MKKYFNLVIFIFIFILGVYIIKAGYIMFQKSVYKTEYSRYVEKYSVLYDVDKFLVYSVIKCESDFNPNAVSGVDARGLMQITRETFEWAQMRMNDTSLKYDESIFDPETNIKFGTYILKLLTQEFKHRDTVISAYHAGWGIVKKWVQNPQISDENGLVKNIPGDNTRRYVESVNEAYNIYKNLYEENE